MKRARRSFLMIPAICLAIGSGPLACSAQNGEIAEVAPQATALERPPTPTWSTPSARSQAAPLGTAKVALLVAEPEPADSEGRYGAKHMVVMYAGAWRTPAGVTRTKDEARRRAEEFLRRVRGGASFDDLVGQYSDEAGAGDRQGDLGLFKPEMMVATFSDAVKNLRIGETSGVVESQFGFHVIVRTH